MKKTVVRNPMDCVSNVLLGNQVKNDEMDRNILIQKSQQDAHVTEFVFI
jgi:hypothetical protein